MIGRVPEKAGEKKARILMIDDEEDLCLSVRANLQEVGGYEVLIATDGRMGLEVARAEQPDLILLDVRMPGGMDGLEVLKRLKENHHTLGIPVLMLTAKQDEKTKAEAAFLYDDDYIEKPVSTQVLQSRIEKALSKRGRL